METNLIKEIGKAYIGNILGRDLDDVDVAYVIDKLREHNSNFDKALNYVEEFMSVSDAIENNDKGLMGIKAATVMLFAIYAKRMKGENISQFTDDDWKEIRAMLKKYVVDMDPRDYTIAVFDTYRRSIAFACDKMRDNATQDAVEKLDEITTKLEELNEALVSEAITEVTYVEECLWLCLEGVMIVLIDRMGVRLLSEKHQEIVNAIGALTFQMFKYKMNSEELAVLDECIAYQREVDSELEAQLETIIERYNKELDDFDVLIDDAFSGDSHNILAGSVAIGNFVGVDDRELLHDLDEIDAFFM